MALIKNIIDNGITIEDVDRKVIKITEYTWNGKLLSYEYERSKIKNGNKICLHLGFLIRTLSDKRWINPKVLYNKRDGIIDLRKVEDHKYILQPKESILIFTNEAIKLGPEYLGIIISKTSLEERGITVSTSYVDTGSKSILQLIVTNNSETPKLLKERCEIADLILVKVDQKLKKITPKRIDQDSITWEMINDNPIFPRWEDRKRTWFMRLCHTIRTYWILFTGVGIVGGCAVIYQTVMLVLSISGFLT